ncbi:hypothetical protein HYDPIDRAFT_109548 [Hydnomerulius pinastri MD-312]|nr:hypothetical protein HYDPIDRAFT_109548 [Hydnomerulius pinastri MD-312]
MVKSKDDTIADFNKQVNMTMEELESWLKSEQSHKAGTGVGLESGAKIVEILRKNPDMDPEKYEEADLNHMRKVVGYNSRHLSQEDHLKETKTREQLANAKSTISLKNWGHDPVKSLEEKEEAGRAPDEADTEVPEEMNQEASKTGKGTKRKRDGFGEPKLARDKKRPTSLESRGQNEKGEVTTQKTPSKKSKKTSSLDKTA